MLLSSDYLVINYLLKGGDLLEMIRVVSSNVHSVGYENSILTIRFLNNYVYEYYNVPEKIYIALLNAPSKGQFVHYYLSRYPYRRIR